MRTKGLNKDLANGTELKIDTVLLHWRTIMSEEEKVKEDRDHRVFVQRKTLWFLNGSWASRHILNADRSTKPIVKCKPIGILDEIQNLDLRRLPYLRVQYRGKMVPGWRQAMSLCYPRTISIALVLREKVCRLWYESYRCVESYERNIREGLKFAQNIWGSTEFLRGELETVSFSFFPVFALTNLNLDQLHLCF